ncbi:MAG: immunity 71 family protein [Azoarcus sp.]|jgi:hypothetical protein|nr:immunity 71 family protein [Azoarcus sp.]
MIIVDNSLILPDELERRQLFHLLKKYSSWTMWNRIKEFFKKWEAVAEESVRQADNAGLFPARFIPPDYTTPDGVIEDTGQSSIHYSDYARIVEDYALMDEGVRRLGQGDKRVFTYDEANGCFVKAGMVLDYWLRIESKLEDREMGWEEKTPLTKEFFEAAGELAVAWGEFTRNIIENRYEDVPAPLSYALWEAVFLSRLPYPDPLPELPEIYDEVTIATGEAIPCTGIWEPMDGDSRAGTMNYLHGGAYAPQAEQNFLNQANRDYGFGWRYVDVIWRLIWRDDRYEDGKIPEEEKSYIFLNPPPPGTEQIIYCDPTGYINKHGIEHPFLDRKRPPWGRCDGGGQCPKEGWWTSHAAPDRIGRRYFKQGETMPNFPLSTWGATIWYLEDPWGERQKK